MAHSRIKYSPNLKDKKARGKPASPRQKAASEIYHQKQLAKPKKTFICPSTTLCFFKNLTMKEKLLMGLIILLSGQTLIQILRLNNFFDSVGHDYATNKNAMPLCGTGLIKAPQAYPTPRTMEEVLAESSIPATMSNCFTMNSYNAPQKCLVQPTAANGNPGAYVLKEHDRSHMFWEKGIIDKTNALQIKFNQEFVCKNLGIQHASIKIFSIDNKTYTGSKFIPDFYSMSRYKSIIGRFFSFKSYDSTLIRNKFGHEPVRQLAVANMFIHDLNDYNVGFNKEGLVIIDSDLTPPTNHITTYLYINIINFSNFQFHLTLNDIVHMKIMFENMKTISLPNDPTQVGISADVYEKVLMHAIELCDEVYDQFKDSTQDTDAPNGAINQKIIEELSLRWAQEHLLLAEEMKQRKLIN